MQFMSSNRSGLLVLGAMFLIAVLGIVATHAGDLSDSATTDAVNPPLNVREANVDATGNIKVHEQGTVAVTGTVNVGNNPATQDVRVTNSSLKVSLGGTVKKLDVNINPFEEDFETEVDIAEFSRVRLFLGVNGPEDTTVNFFYSTDGGVGEFIDIDRGHGRSIFLGEAAGTKLTISARDPDGEQVLIRVFGTY